MGCLCCFLYLVFYLVSFAAGSAEVMTFGAFTDSQEVEKLNSIAPW